MQQRQFILVQLLEKRVDGLNTSDTNVFQAITHSHRYVSGSDRRWTTKNPRQNDFHRQGFGRSVDRLATAISNLYRRTMSVQVELVHCSDNVSHSLFQLTSALPELQTASVASMAALSVVEWEDA